jgi:hypothetical protein
MPLLPPRSPRKNKGPRPRPTSTFPPPVVIDCEKEFSVEEIKMRASTIARPIGTIRFIDTRFSGFLYIGFTANKIENKHSKSNL